MITAKNYAAQVEKHCREIRKHFEKKEMVVDAFAMLLLENLIIDAQHFAIPDNGVIFNDNLKGAVGLEFRMPYPAVTIEYYVPPDGRPLKSGEVEPRRRLILCADTDHPDLNNNRFLAEEGVLTVPFWGSPDEWSIPHGGLFVPRQWDCTDNAVIIPGLFEGERPANNQGFVSKPVIILPETKNITEKRRGEEWFRRFTLLNIENMSPKTTAALEFFEALSCSNVTATPLEKIDPAKNARRIRDGKLPLYETKVLTVDCPSARYPRQSTGEPSNRASPREHLRRGHIRRLESGKRIWVNSAVIGSAGIGRIDKRYEIRSAD